MKLLSYIYILAFGIYPLIPEHYEKFTVIFLLVYSFFSFFKQKNRQVFNKQFFTFGFVFFVFLISAILSENQGLAFKRIGTMSSLLIIPFCFYILQGNKSDQNLDRLKMLFYNSFFVSNIIFSLSCFYAYTIFVHHKYPNKDANFFRNAMTDVLAFGDHPTYISIFISIGILFGVNLILIKKESIFKKIFIFLGLIILLTNLLMLMSKAVIITLVLALLLLLILKLKMKKRIILFFTLVFSILFYVVIPNENNRFKELFKVKTYLKVDPNNSTSVRSNILKCNIKLIKENPIIGFGLGDVKGKLTECYNSEGFKFDKEYNSHNQYFYIWLSCGIIGFSLFLFWLFQYYKFAYFFKDYLLMSILLLYSICFLFENVLSRQSGVIFFSFIANFLIYFNFQTNNKTKAKV